jgi:hypothetical protein
MTEPITTDKSTLWPRGTLAPRASPLEAAETHRLRSERAQVVRTIMGNLRPASVKAPQFLFFFFEGDSNISVGRQANLIAFDIRDETTCNEVVMPLMGPFAAIFLCQLDPVSLDAVDRPDMHAIGTNDFHMFSDLLHGLLLD